MNRFSWSGMLAAGVLLAAVAHVHAQELKDPHIGFVYPAGGKIGTTFQVTVGGEFLQGVTEGHVSGGGVKITIVKYFQHLFPNQAARFGNARRKAVDRLKEREKAKGGSADRVFTPEEIEKEANFSDYEKEQEADVKMRNTQKKRQLNPQLMQDVTLEITIDPKAQVGERELRLLTQTGMSNPLFFHVSKFPEVRETEPNDITPDSAVGDLMPVVINGQIMPGDIDRFTFKAKKGMRLVAIAGCRELMPYLADAVPGWFQGVLTLYDPDGDDVAFASSAFGFRQDPVLFYEVPKDGEYVLEVRDSIYRGREDFVYRVALGELPYITSIFPLGGRASLQVDVQLQGWNLPINKMTFEPIFDRGRAIRPFNVRTDDGTASNRVPFAVDAMNEITDTEPNDTVEKAQAITLPMIVNGRMDKPGDVDVFCFEGRAHEKIVAEVYGRRLGSPIDSFLRLTDENGREEAFNDDYEDKSLALSTHHADSRMVIDLPSSGKHYLHVSESQRKGGSEYVYRLQIRYPRPDFELRVVPSSICAKPGSSVPITVYALRKDGQAEDILLDLDKPPAGYKLNGAWVPGALSKVRLTLTVPNTPTPEPINLELMGHSISHGRKILHWAVPAEAMMQAFAYQHVVPAKDWTVMVTARGSGPVFRNKPTLQFVRDEREKLRMTVGGTVKVRIAGAAQPRELYMELSEPPDGITIKNVVAEGDIAVVTIQTDPAKVKVGQKGNLLFNAFWDHTIEFKKSEDKKPQQVRTPLGMMPAIQFEIAPGK